MKIENFEYLQGRLEARGWEGLVPQLKQRMEAGEAEFSLKDDGEVDGNRVDFELKFRKHSEHDFYYFNRINTVFSRDGVEVAKASFRESWNLMPEEMYNIMNHGSKVAVHKEGIKNEAGEPFNAWITVNVDKPLNEEGFLNLNTYHDNYYKKHPFDLDNALDKLPLPVKELIPENMDSIRSGLMQGIPIPVTYELESENRQGFISVNAKIGRVDLLDSNMELVQVPKQQLQQEKGEQQGETQALPAAQVDEVKKKPWQNRQQTVKWGNKKGKGMSV